MSDSELEEIEERSAATSDGEWKSYVEGRDHTSGDSFIKTGNGNDIYLSGATLFDQDFIANARQDIPKLLAEIRRLKSG